jgi:hypothetical protein
MATMRRVVAQPVGRAALEVVKQDLYDTQDYPATGLGVLEFFKNPNVNGELWTNMVASGQLPNPQKFEVEGIAVEIFPELLAFYGTDVTAFAEFAIGWSADKAAILDGAWLKLKVGVKDYLTIPLRRIPGGVGPAGLAIGSLEVVDNSALTTHGIQDVKHCYDVTIRLSGATRPILVPSQQSFLVALYWPNVITHGLLDVAGKATVVAKIRVYLIGTYYREVQ